MIYDNTVMSNKESNENCIDTIDPGDGQSDPPSVTWQDISGMIDSICLGVSTTILSFVLLVAVSEATSK